MDEPCLPSDQPRPAATDADVWLVTDWEHDRDFFALLDESLRRRKLRTRAVWPQNLATTLQALRGGRPGARFVLDRGSATAPEYRQLYAMLASAGARFLDDPGRIRWASDKATMHLEFMSTGIRVPHTLILAPYRDSERLSLSPNELARLGTPFVVKPANTTGGGIGVFEHATSVEDILAVRQQHPDDKYLVQERICPQEKDGRRFWFRVFHVCGSLFATWWHDVSHLYAPVLAEQVERYALEPLYRMVQIIARVCRLNFFSTEIALDRAGEWVTVDYVNDSCDMRLQSRHVDGVPDHIVRSIAERIAEYARVESQPPWRAPSHAGS